MRLTRLVFVFVGAAHIAAAQQAFVRSDDETGQAMLRARGDRCYAITPQHVLGSETTGLLTAPGRALGEGDVLRRVPAAPEPVLLLGVRGLPASVCPPFEGSERLDDLFVGQPSATLRLVRPDGSFEFVPLSLSSVETETFEVRAGPIDLKQGMSGGTILIGALAAGLLTDVTNGGKVGRAMRLDRVFERIDPHLGSALPVEAPPAASGSVPYEIVRSNAEPILPENRVSSLQGDGPGPWRVQIRGRAELLLKVAAPIGRIAVDETSVTDPPRFLEVLAGRTEHGPWQPLVTLGLEPGDKVQERRFIPTRLPFVLLRASPVAAQETLGIKRVSLYPP